MKTKKDSKTLCQFLALDHIIAPLFSGKRFAIQSHIVLVALKKVKKAC